MDPDSVEIDVEDIPPGYVLVRKENGLLAFLKMEPDNDGEEEEKEEHEQQHQIIEEVIQEGDADMEVTEVMEGDDDQEEIDIDEIPDIVEEDLPPDLSPESIDNTLTNDEEDFIGRTVVSGSSDAQYSGQKFKIHAQSPTLWRGVNIPPHSTKGEIDLFKARHLLQRLSDRVKRNRQKVDIFEKKNDTLRSLIANQRDKMIKRGFHIKDVVRHHNVRKRKDPGPTIPPPLMAFELMDEMERLGYERTRLEAESAHLRKRLKALLSGYRRYKKVFVENHEKLKKGPKRRENMPLYQKREAIRMQQASPDSESDTGGTIKPYKCYHCRYGARTKAELRSHIEGHQTKKQYECCVCSFFTSRITQFLEHMKTHPGAKAFRCKHCDFRTAYPSAMRNHEATHLTVKPYKCLVCGFRTVRSDHLRNHMRKHKNDRAFKCELCPFTSKYSSGLSKHKKTMHYSTGPTKKWNSYSERSTKNQLDSDSDGAGETTEIEIDENGQMLYVRHIGKSTKKQSSSEQNERRRSQRQNVKKVMVDYVEGDEFDENEGVMNDDSEPTIHNVKTEQDEDEVNYEELEENESDEELDGENELLLSEPDDSPEEMTSVCEPTQRRDLLSSYVIYQCVFCEYSCEMKQNLVSHLRSHMDYWSFTCRACNFTASSPTDLQTHTEDHKNEGENNCPYCDHLTTSRDKLKKHIEKRHPPGKPLACIYCDYISSSRSSMKAHMQGHQSKKVWQCLICSYKADFRSGLKRHLRKHTGERPYHCPHCEFNAAQYSHLTRHLRRNHPQEGLLEIRPPSPFVIL